MNRRHFITLMGSLPILSPATAQTPVRIFRIALVSPAGPVPESSPNGKMLFSALAEHGYAVGQNLVVQGPQQATGGPEHLAQVMKDLKADKVDVIVTWGYPTILAAKQAGIPAVAVFGAGDPVETGLVESLARPGGSITGISDVATTLTTKRMGLLKELKPSLRSVAMIWNKDDLGMSLRYAASAKSAEAMGVSVLAVGVREPDDFDEAFSVIDRERPDAILMVSDSLTTLNRKRVFEFANAHHMPAIYEYDPLVREGGLMSYGPDLRESFGRAAAKADQILRGAKPGDLPFEQPTRYLFLINLKTAKLIGLEIPPTLLALADEVIE
jgi:putative tryptophan/tyrosine transport system substrate-binding protein